jgi:cysteine-rich repeat protein
VIDNVSSCDRQRRGAWALRRTLAGVLCAALSLPLAAMAHNQPVPLDVWGPFLPGTPECLRAITRATHTCFDTTGALETAGQQAIAGGGTCDREAVDDAIEEAARHSRQVLGVECTTGQLTELNYIGFFDAQADLTNACVIQGRATVEAIYAPARFSTPTPLECIAETAAYSRQVQRFILDRQRPMNERIAVRLFDADRKREMLLNVERELSADRPRWITGLTEHCPEFSAVYGRSADSFLRTMKQRTDCVLSLTYVHTSSSCLGQVCGNGIKEATEECDDGNSNGADTCALNCTLN